MKSSACLVLLLLIPFPQSSQEKRVAAIREGLDWLVRHQNEDGSWSSRFPERCKGEKCQGKGNFIYDVGVTGLSLLALKPEKAKYRKQIELGLKWLVSQQTDKGAFGEILGEYFYVQAVATQALVAYFPEKDFSFVKEPAIKGVAFLQKYQCKGSDGFYRGWRYKPGDGQSDTSATSWAILALKEAESAGVLVPKEHFDGALAWIKDSTNEEGMVGYLSKEDAGAQVKVPNMNEEYKNHNSMTAIGVYVRHTLGNVADPEIKRGVEVVASDPPSWNKFEKNNDYYYWHRGTLAIKTVGGPSWKEWKTKLEEVLTNNQNKKGCSKGSWDADDRWGMIGGRVYATAMNVLSLELTR